MKKKFILLSIALFNLAAVHAQWSQKANLAGGGRGLCAAFGISDNIYVFGGSTSTSNVYKELWEYNTLNNTWTQKADYPGGKRVASTAFSIGTKGYVGLGSDFTNYFTDLWEYDPSANGWVQKADFPGAARQSATGLAIGGKGYVGGGLTYNGTFTLYHDFWEYDPAADTWLQKTNIPGPLRSDAVACTIGNMVYFGLGTDKMFTSFTDFYAYDPAADTWSALSSPTGSFTGASAMFAIGTDCYLVGGHDWSNNTTTGGCQVYNTLTDTWSAGSSYPGGSVYYHVAVSLNGKGYVGTGGTAALVPRKDWWVYAVPPATVTSISTNNEDQSALTVYPNPFRDKITLSFHGTQTRSDHTFYVTDVLGRDVFHYCIDTGIASEYTIELPASLNHGIYSYSVISDEGISTASGKLVKE